MTAPPGRATQHAFGPRVMSVLTSRSGPIVFGGFLAWFLVWSVVATLAFEVTVPEGNQRNLAIVAAPLIPALGAMFAFLTAFAINTEWGQLREAQHAAELEADAAARFALVAGSPGLDAAHLRRLLQSYLLSVVDEEWALLPDGRGSETARQTLGRMFRETRAIVSGPSVPAVTGGDLLHAVDSLISLRRDRLSLASRSMPPALLLLAFASGVVLCLDAVLLALPYQQWEAVTVGGVVVVVALALALVVAVSAPFKGTISVDAHPIAVVLDELSHGDLDVIGPP
jgi:hypothetical protein